MTLKTGVMADEKSVLHHRNIFYTVCVCTLDGLNAEHKFRVWVTILGCMSRQFHFHFQHLK